jgi:hypothetical protein
MVQGKFFSLNETARYLLIFMENMSRTPGRSNRDHTTDHANPRKCSASNLYKIVQGYKNVGLTLILLTWRIW